MRALENPYAASDLPELSYTHEMDGVMVHPEMSAKGRAIVQRQSPIPNGYILPGSENYVVRESENGPWWRYYSKTTFGGALVLDERDVTNMLNIEPNIVIAGNGAVIHYYLGDEQTWSTLVAASNDVKQYRFVADGRLQGDQKTAFIEFCRKIVEDDY